MQLFSKLMICFVICGNCLFSQDFSGRYALATESGEIILELKQSGKNRYSGELSGNGNVFALSGAAENGRIFGSVGEALDGIRFEGSLQGGEFTLAMSETDDRGQPIPGTVQILTFRQVDSGADKTHDAATDKSAVIINNVVLDKAQQEELTKTYGVTPRAGNYWYDAKSGLYGVAGYPAFGFMYAGHPFGKLDRGASAGNTGVIVNNRELPQAEWAVWSYILGYWIQPGAYWLDANGNAGYVGNSTALVNFYVAAQQNTYRGQGGSGDNFWSSRFSAGNYDRGNQRGYVSVPGHGPVGYGFD